MTLKDDIKKIMQQKSGRRFRYAHLYLKKRWGNHFVLKLILGLLSILSILIGLILLFIPGPGLLFIAIGFMFIAVISFSVAHWLDKLEMFIRKKYKEWMKKKEKNNTKKK
ncbi:MAG: hypothetical protein A3F17_08445 [Gammaproteobacteria bacterium RIFCSPHIGHO2_12_FULL_41_15]|nr:MAG: hypothetical protein A3F17_08445 [Gammaproteobacteria bacterium RIFCSPHIGHO2_12_FULL_41_15]